MLSFWKGTFLKRKVHIVDSAMNWAAWMRVEEGGIEVAVTLSSIDWFGKYFLNARHCSRHGWATGNPDRLVLCNHGAYIPFGVVDNEQMNKWSRQIQTEVKYDEENTTGWYNRVVRKAMARKVWGGDMQQRPQWHKGVALPSCRERLASRDR